MIGTTTVIATMIQMNNMMSLSIADNFNKRNLSSRLFLVLLRNNERYRNSS